MTSTIAHIRKAADIFAKGGVCYYVETAPGESVKSLHRKLWRLVWKRGYKWALKKYDGLHVMIKPRQQ